MCYTVPVAGAIVTSALWGKTKNTRILWLNLLFWGGALFGVVDHLWNGELFLISENIISDLLLGITIAAVIMVWWGVMVFISKTSPILSQYSKAQTKPL
jgi:hypothetical protein